MSVLTKRLLVFNALLSTVLAVAAVCVVLAIKLTPLPLWAVLGIMGYIAISLTFQMLIFAGRVAQW